MGGITRSAAVGRQQQVFHGAGERVALAAQGLDPRKDVLTAAGDRPDRGSLVDERHPKSDG